MLEPKELLGKLKENDLFKDWKKNNPNSFLTHFFSRINSEFVLGSWEVGFFNNDKITVFTEQFEIKPADDIFKKQDAKVEELSLDNVKISQDQAIELFKENFEKYFPGQKLGDGFLILQKYKDQTSWNFTFISKAVQFLNMKFDSSTGEVIDHQVVDLIDRK